MVCDGLAFKGFVLVVRTNRTLTIIIGIARLFQGGIQCLTQNITYDGSHRREHQLHDGNNRHAQHLCDGTTRHGKCWLTIQCRL